MAIFGKKKQEEEIEEEFEEAPIKSKPRKEATGYIEEDKEKITYIERAVTLELLNEKLNFIISKIKE